MTTIKYAILTGEFSKTFLENPKKNINNIKVLKKKKIEYFSN
jgi:hypothetical protein|nr:hypothetical protein [Methanobrevibacter arboriphilus]